MASDDRETSRNDDDEAQSLLGKNTRAPTPLPVVQLLVLALIRLAEPIAFTQASSYRTCGYHGENVEAVVAL